MTTEQTAQQLELAAQILRTGHPWGYRIHKGRIRSYVCPSQVIADGNLLIPILATPPDNRPLHNPDNLTAEQVGVGHRLTLPGEKLDANYDYWLVEEGWKKGHGTGVASELIPEAAMRLPLSVPWPEPADPYAELKAAHAAGKVIQYRPENNEEWSVCHLPRWSKPLECYRIKPEPFFQLPPCAPGMCWHKEDGWTADDLPSGYRPLYRGEKVKHGDQVWHLFANWHDSGNADQEQSNGLNYRTTRPLTFEHAGKTWAWHRPGDPMPCDGDSSVNILCRDEQCFAPSRSLLAKNVNWDECYLDGFDVLGWRYADEKKTVPLGREDTRCGDEVQDAALAKLKPLLP